MMKEVKILRVLFWILACFLGLFIGTGTYFILYGGAAPAGYFAIGIGIFGIGLIGLVGNGVVFNVKPEFLENADMIVPEHEFTLTGPMKRTDAVHAADQAMVHVCADGLCMENFYPTLMMLKYSNIKEFKAEEDGIHVSGRFALNGEVRDGAFLIEPTSSVKKKAFVTTVEKKIAQSKEAVA